MLKILLSFSGYIVLVVISWCYYFIEAKQTLSPIRRKYYSIILFFNLSITIFDFVDILIKALANGEFNVSQINANILSIYFLSGYIIVSFLLTRLLRQDVVYLSIIGVLFVLSCYASFIESTISIIDIVWYAIFTIDHACIIIVTYLFSILNTKTLLEHPFNQTTQKLAEYYHCEINKYMKLGIQSYLALGASLGVSMSILYQNANGNWYDFELLCGAIAMLVAFLIVGVSLFIWVYIPYILMSRDITLFYNQQLYNSK